jgi:hypothetical protein
VTVTGIATGIGNVTGNVIVIVIVIESATVTATAIRTVIEVKTMTKSRGAPSTIAAVVMMLSTKLVMVIVLLTVTIKSETKTILLRGRRKTASTVGLPSIMREMMGRNVKEKETGTEREGSGTMFLEERVGRGVFRSEGMIRFTRREQRRCYKLFPVLL